MINMIREVVGDLVNVDADIICHQANYHGMMGGGVALSIWNKLLAEPSRTLYQEHCAETGRDLLGTVQFLRATRFSDGYETIVANLFCQDEYQQEDGGLTRYDYMRVCLSTVEATARAQNLRCVALPGYIGCGIAGGDWNTVYSIIRDVFDSSPVELIVVYWNKHS